MKYDKASFSKTVNKDSIHVTSEAETIENILKHEESAAAIMCRMKSEAEALSMDHSLTKDVNGIVATLGKVDDDNLSRLFPFSNLLFFVLESFVDAFKFLFGCEGTLIHFLAGECCIKASLFFIYF